MKKNDLVWNIAALLYILAFFLLINYINAKLGLVAWSNISSFHSFVSNYSLIGEMPFMQPYIAPPRENHIPAPIEILM